jgi:uncharacterized protein
LSGSLASVFHAGELAVQERAGVRDQAGKIGTGIRAVISPAAQAFLGAQRMAIVASVSATGAVWASLVSGPPGFLEAIDERRLRVHARPHPGDPLEDGLRGGADLGLLAIDLANRKRLRLNGRAALHEAGFEIVTREVFGNCPKYIQARVAEEGESPAASAPEVRRGALLDEPQTRWIHGADTFFIATRHAAAGADASHRGGDPGFVQVLDGSRLAWPDYSGNRMFQTLGNLHADPRAGLLFVDFSSGASLQLTGRATVDWDAARAATLPGAERVVDFAVDEVVEIRDARAPRHRFVARSPFNPTAG